MGNNPFHRANIIYFRKSVFGHPRLSIKQAMFPGFFIYIKFILQKKINYQITRGIIRKGIAVFILLAMIFTKLIAQQPRNIDTAITKQKDIIDVLLKVFKINLAKADTA